MASSSSATARSSFKRYASTPGSGLRDAWRNSKTEEWQSISMYRRNVARGRGQRLAHLSDSHDRDRREGLVCVPARAGARSIA